MSDWKGGDARLPGHVPPKGRRVGFLEGRASSRPAFGTPCGRGGARPSWVPAKWLAGDAFYVFADIRRLAPAMAISQAGQNMVAS